MKSLANLAWDKMQGLLPAIVQDVDSNAVLMLAYMNQPALEQTLATQWVTFFSRSKNSLWVKGETSGNKLALVDIVPDCDGDSLLVLAKPQGPTCHTGDITCFGSSPKTNGQFLAYLELLIADREEKRPTKSYTTELFTEGLNRIAQKLGEEAVEVVIAALTAKDAEFTAEVADLMYHLLVLLRARKLTLADVLQVLKARG